MGKSATKAKSTSRIGMGEFADPGGIVPLIIGRLQYLEALASECPAAKEELRTLAAPVIVAVAQHHDAQAKLAGPGVTPAPTGIDEQWLNTVMRHLSEVTGISFDLPNAAPSSQAPPFPALPDGAPETVRLHQEFLRAVKRLGKWMQRWGLPADDFGWCAIVCCWVVVTSEVGPINPPQTVDESAQLHDSELADYALLDPGVLKGVIDSIKPYLDRLPRLDDAESVGKWLAELVDEKLGHAYPVTLPPMTWNPRLETRSSAETRLISEATARIREQLGNTELQLSSRGIRRTQVKMVGEEHCRWVVRNQVLGRSHRAIAKEVFLTREAVRKGIAETASSIHLPLRQVAQGGRPRKHPSFKVNQVDVPKSGYFVNPPSRFPVSD